MTRSRIVFPLAALIALTAALASAQTYKCTSSDGRVSFQDQPCAGAAKSATVTIAPDVSSAASNEASAALQKKLNDDRARTADRAKRDAATQKDAEVSARMNAACAQAKEQLEIAQDPRPIYRQDKDGNALFVQEKDRATTVANLEKRVRAVCKS